MTNSFHTIRTAECHHSKPLCRVTPLFLKSHPYLNLGKLNTDDTRVISFENLDPKGQLKASRNVVILRKEGLGSLPYIFSLNELLKCLLINLIGSGIR